LAPLLASASFYVTGNPPDGHLMTLLLILVLLMIIYPIILYHAQPKNLFHTILLHLVLYLLVSFPGMFIHRNPLSEMGGLIYFLMPSGITLALIISYPLVLVIRKINSN
jgi:hypothetical protein